MCNTVLRALPIPGTSKDTTTSLRSIMLNIYFVLRVRMIILVRVRGLVANEAYFL